MKARTRTWLLAIGLILMVSAYSLALTRFY